MFDYVFVSLSKLITILKQSEFSFKKDFKNTFIWQKLGTQKLILEFSAEEM